MVEFNPKVCKTQEFQIPNNLIQELDVYEFGVRFKPDADNKVIEKIGTSIEDKDAYAIKLKKIFPPKYEENDILIISPNRMPTDECNVLIHDKKNKMTTISLYKRIHRYMYLLSSITKKENILVKMKGKEQYQILGRVVEIIRKV